MEKDYLKEFYTLEQLSKELDINIQYLRTLIKNNDLQASKLGKRYIVTREQVNELLRKNIVIK